MGLLKIVTGLLALGSRASALRLTQPGSRSVAGQLKQPSERFPYSRASAFLSSLHSKVTPLQMAESGNETDSMRTLPSHSLDTDTRRTGRVTKINAEDAQENKQALERENLSAAILAEAGYSVEQNPTVEGTTRNPDYRIEGKVFDCYAPTTSKPRSIWATLEGKVKKGQAQRFILNLDGSAVDVEALSNQFRENTIVGLQEIIIINKDKTILSFFPQ